MRIVFLLCSAVLAFTLSGTTSARAADKGATAAQVAAALEAGYAGLHDLQADFTQKTTIVSLKREQRGSGEVFLKRAMFRFNYVKPRQQIVSDGKQLWFYQPENRQVMVYPLAEAFKGGNSIALSYLTGLGNVSRDFTVAFAREQRDKAGNYQLDLTPRKPTAAFSRLRLSIPAEAVDQYLQHGTVKNIFPVAASVIYDAGGNETRIDYSRPRVNRGIDNGKFSFKIPAGVEVIKP